MNETLNTKRQVSNKRNINTRLLLALIILLGISPLRLMAELPTVKLLNDNFYYYTADTKESLYAISKRCNLDYTQLQKWNILADGEVKKGQTIFYPVADLASNQDNDASVNAVIYTVRFGDTLPSLAERFNTTVKDIFVENESLTTDAIKPGEQIKILQNSASALKQLQVVTTDKIYSFQVYTAEKGDSWDGISAKYNVPVALLKSANPGISQIKKNSYIVVPRIENKKETINVFNRDERESSFDGVEAIYQEVLAERGPKELNVTVILSNPKSKKDIDFSRGFLTALDMFDSHQYKVILNFVDGSASNILQNEDVQNANLIIATYEKDFPEEIALLGKSGKRVINVFDLKDTSYRTTKGVYNLLQGSEQFNQEIADAILDKYKDAQFVFLGDPLNADDSVGIDVMNHLQIDQFEVADDLKNVIAPYSGDFVIYVFATKKDGINSALKMIKEFQENNPGHDNITVIGRPTWLLQTEHLSTEMHSANTIIPSRFYFDDNASATKAFTNKYKSLFSKEPVKSYPMYAYMGYDVANYFLNSSNDQSLQINFDFQQVGQCGEYNAATYFINLMPNGKTEAILLNK